MRTLLVLFLLAFPVFGQFNAGNPFFTAALLKPSADGGGGITEIGGGSQRASVQSTSGLAIGGTTNVAYPGNVTSGNMLIVAGSLWWQSGPGEDLTITDTLGTSWTVTYYTGVSATWKTYIAMGIAPSSGANTVNLGVTSVNSGIRSVGGAIDEFSGVTQLDVDGSGSTGTSTTASDGITTVASSSLIIGVMSQDGSTMSLTLQDTPNWTLIAEDEDNTGAQCFSVGFRIVSSATAYTYSTTLGSSALWGAQTMSFKP